MNTFHLPDDLPVLTNIVAANGAAIAIPTLTEVIPDSDAPLPVELTELLPPIEFHSAALHEMELSLPASSAAEPLPPLAEIDSPPVVSNARDISPAEMQLLLDHFTTHLESVFTEKLDRHLQQLHHQAIRLAILELKEELPELLHSLLPPSGPGK